MKKRKEARSKPFNDLGFIAIRMANQCYHPQASSNEVVRAFLIGVQQIRNKESKNASLLN